MTPSSRAVVRPLPSAGAAILAALLLAGASAIPPVFAQATGGFIEKADRLAARARWTPAQIRSFLPRRGGFTFPAPYDTRGVRLTNPSDCAGGDCVQPLGGTSWRNINNHRGRDTMLIFLGLRGSGPTLFGYDKRTDQVRNLGPLFDAASAFASHSAEGWYFSATQPTRLYVSDGGPALLRYDVETRAFETVFDATGQFGEGIGIDHAHSSDDDHVHSALLRDSASHRVLGCLAYREKVQRFSYYPATADGDECEVDKSGRWLLIRQRAGQADAEDDRIVDLETGAEKTLIGETAAGGPSDTGHGYLLAKDASSSLAAAVRVWDFEQSPPPGRVMYQAPSAAGDLRHVAHSNSRADVDLSRQFACGSTGTTPSGSRPGEIVCFRLDASQDVLVVAQTMVDPSARGGGADREPANGNLDVTGRYFLWVGNTGGGRADAFLVKVPAERLVGASAAPLDLPIAVAGTASVPADRVPVPRVDTVVTLSPQDTFLNIDASNNSADPLLRTYTWPSRQVANAILMKFDLSAIPAGAVVSDASLGLALLQSDSGPESTYTVSAHKVVGKNPVIAAATGYTTDGATAWTATTCCFGNVPLAQADISPPYDAPAVDKTFGYKSWSVTAIAQEWVASPATNFGLLLDSDASALADRYRSFASMEHADPSLRPFLRITYSMTPDVTPPVVSAIGTSAITATGAAIAWTTEEPSDSQVEYGTTTAYGLVSPLAGTRVKSHAVTLTGLSAGTLYHFRVRSRDFAGNLAVSGDSTFTTLAGDLTPPTVSITTPLAGATVTRQVTIAASASDNVAVVGVQLKVDGANLGSEITSPSYARAWNTMPAPKGSHTLTAVARDAAGNLSTAAAVTVTVGNDTTPPTVSITAPAPGATLSGTVTVAASASDNSGVVGVQFELNGAKLGAEEDASPPYSVSWNTTAGGDGSYSLTAVARDAAGNSTRSASVNVTVANGVAVLVPQDTYIGLNAVNQSTIASLNTYTWPDNKVANAILMKFDLSVIPPGATVTDATLRLSLVASDAAPEATYTVTAHKLVGRNPVIAAATGYTADGVVAWTPNSCCSSSVPLAQADISAPYDTRAIDKAVGYKSWSLTTMVREWVASPTTNFGLLLNSDPSKARDRYRTFASMEHADPALRPSLRITYSLTPDVTPPVITAVAASAVTVSGASVNWVTDEPSNSQVEYGTTAAYGSLTALDPAPVTSHAAALSGLASNTLYHFRVRSRDSAGNLALSGDFTLTTLAGDATPPVVSITTPAAGATVSGSVTIGASASDDVGVVGVQFKVDGASLGAEATESPYARAWNTKTATNGSHVLTAVARDAAGHVTTSPAVTVTVANDLTPPSVSITAPVAGATVSGMVTVAATASDNVGVVGVQFKLDGANLGLEEDATFPYSASWNSSSVTNGNHTLTAVVRDAAGNTATSAAVTISVVNDATPPSVAITVPVSGATVSGTPTIGATASDNVAVAGVQFKVDGANVGAEDTAPPYAVSWSTATVANGSHALTAVARDPAGNVATSATVTVTVANDTTPPSASITAPAAGTTVSGTVAVTASASDNVGVIGVQFKLDGANLGAEDTSSPYSASWNTTAATNGSHTLTAVARDAAGNSRTSSGITVTVSNDATPPAVSITAPAGGATVSGTVTVTANASDNVGVAGVQFKLDGANLGAEDTSSPYSASWSTTGSSNGSHTLTAVARDAASNQATSAAVTVTVSNTPPAGIAALYPGDVGIEANPDVVFVERFEEPTLTDLFGRWTDILNGVGMSWSPDVPAGSPGTHSVDIPWVGGGVTNGGHLYKQLSPGVDDTLYVRYYIKYPTSGKYNHTGVWMGGANPPLAWPNPQAGIKPAGNDRFSAGAERSNATLRFDHYDYWMDMHQSNDGNYWGNLLRNDPNLVVNGGQWMCVEHMVKLNNPVTSSNGEHAIWINGVKVSHVGLGFPNGSWSGGIFTQSPSGTPFGGLRWRSDANLKLNWIWLQNYSPDDPAGFQGHMYFDHLVAAKSYIGCLPASGPSDATPPVVSVTAPAAGTTVSGTVALTASASDNVGVAGVQFKLDGINVGAEDTAPPYSVSWVSSTATNGPHTLTAVARDVAGNQTTSPGVGLTVNNVASGGVLFQSNWDTAAGTSSAAVTDGGRWPDYWEFNGGSSVQLLSVVTGGVGGHNALRVQQRGSSFAANLQLDNFAAPSTDYYVRYYMKNDDTSSAGDHIVTADTYQYPNLTYLRKVGGPTSWQHYISLYGCGYTYPIGHWTPSTRLANGQWYRFEYYVHYTASNRVQVHPRVYNAAGTLIFSDADFRQSDYGSQVWNGRNDWTLASYYAAGYDFCVDPTWMNDLGLGNNGQQGAADTGLYWYFAGVQIRTDTWPGPLF